MLYGRNLRFPFDTLVSKIPLDDEELTADAAEHVDKLLDKLKVADQAVRERLLQADERRLQANAAMTKLTTFAVGDKVWLHNVAVKKGLSRKLTSPWTGPYQIVDSYANLVNYKVHRLDKLGRLINHARTKLVHVSRLKKYYDPTTSAIRLADVARSS
jgi:hypothetical protein